MAVGGIGDKPIDWSALLNSVTSTGNVSGTEGPQGPANLVLSEGDKEVLLALLTAPELDPPDGGVENPAEKLESLLEKLQDGKTFDFTEEQTQTFVTTVTALLTKVNQESGGIVGGTPGPKNNQEVQDTNPDYHSTQTSSSKVLFDVYALMALLAECAQEQKNAQRDIRSAETTAVVTSIQNQAAQQRSAALTGLIAGSLVCAMQACAAAYSAIKTVANVRADGQMNQEFGVKQASADLTEAQKQFDADVKAAKADQVDASKHEVMEKGRALKTAMDAKEGSDKYTQLKISEARVKAVGDISMALGNLGQTIVKGIADLLQAEAMAMSADQKKAEEGLEETKDLMKSFQDVIDQVSKLAQAVLQAENDSMNNAIQA